MNKKYKEKIDKNKAKRVKTKKNMADEIKEKINGTTFLKKIYQDLRNNMIKYYSRKK